MFKTKAPAKQLVKLHGDWLPLESVIENTEEKNPSTRVKELRHIVKPEHDLRDKLA